MYCAGIIKNYYVNEISVILHQRFINILFHYLVLFIICILYITDLFYSVQLNFLGGFIQKKCLYPVTSCRVQTRPHTTQTQMQNVIMQLIRSSISQEKRSHMQIQQYSDYYKAKIMFTAQLLVVVNCTFYCYLTMKLI